MFQADSIIPGIPGRGVEADSSIGVASTSGFICIYQMKDFLIERNRTPAGNRKL
jgi:hypothetical protein